jgi:hypothetical protein
MVVIGAIFPNAVLEGQKSTRCLVFARQRMPINPATPLVRLGLMR